MPRRRLSPLEIREAGEVFGPALPYGEIWVHEHARWPTWLARFAALLTRRPPPTAGNAVTLGRSLYFPYPLRTEATHFEERIFGDMAWLIHELTHVWQYVHHGYGYVIQAARKNLSLGAKAYDYGGENGLRRAAARNGSFADFNPEQQGDITRDYYLRRKLGLSTEAWEPFLAEVRGV